MSQAQATPLDQLKNLMPQPGDEAGTETFSETPDGTPIEETQYYGAPRYRAPPPRARVYGNPYRAPYRRGPRFRCRMVRDRRGRLVRVCR